MAKVSISLTLRISREDTPQALPASGATGISFPGGTRYENEDYDYSLALPEGFEPLEGHWMQGNTFLDGKGNSIEVSAEYASKPDEELKAQYDNDVANMFNDATDVEKYDKPGEAFLFFKSAFNNYLARFVALKEAVVAVRINFDDKNLTEEQARQVAASLYVYPIRQK